MESLSEILSGAAAPEETASAPETATDVTTDATTTEASASAPSAEQATTERTTESQSRDDKGRFAGKPDEIAALRTAMQEERRKRQEIERKLAEQPKDDKPKKDLWEDPEGFIEERLTEREQKLRQETEARFFDLCEDLAKQRHADYEAVVSAFMQEAEADPSLAMQAFSQSQASRDKAEFLYNFARNRAEMRSIGGDLGKYRESIEAPLKAKFAEMEAENKRLKSQLDQLSKVPASLNAESSAARADIVADFIEPSPLSEIVKPQKRRA